jgi:hypothetical protein
LSRRPRLKAIIGRLGRPFNYHFRQGPFSGRWGGIVLSGVQLPAIFLNAVLNARRENQRQILALGHPLRDPGMVTAKYGAGHLSGCSALAAVHILPVDHQRGQG